MNKTTFRQRKNFFGKKEQNYASFVLKFGTRKKIFTFILTIYVCKETLSIYTN